ncbi:MAG: portal protein [Methyloceanibacter sp.]|nr:portal protein [Methyloceanibacter sp.]
MGIADDLIAEQAELASARAYWEPTWQEVVEYGLPFFQNFSIYNDQTRGYVRTMEPAQSRERGRKIYDSSSVVLIDQLSAAIESLVTPQAEKWHNLGPMDPFAPDPNDEEEEWYEAVRDYQFQARYNPASGFVTAHQKSIKGCVALGTAVIFVEEFFGDRRFTARQIPARYQHMPLSESYLAADQYGEVDTNIRRYMMTARNAATRFGDKVSDKIMAAANDDKRKHEKFEIIHAVRPRDERGGIRNSNRDSQWASYYVECESRHMIGEGGFHEFPFIVYHWAQTEGSAYGESPVMRAIADIKTLQAQAKTGLQAAQQMIKPPTATMDGVTNRPNLNAGANNPGMIDESGRLRIQPIITARNFTFAEAVQEATRRNLRESLYINLFQVLSDDPNKTATEALIRDREKSEIFSPAGARIQHGLSRMVEREIAIYERKGAFGSEEAPDTALSPPESLQGTEFGPVFSSPLDRLRRANELLGIERTVQTAGAVAQFMPEVLDRIDGDEIVEITQEITGAPRKMLKTRAEVEEVRAQREQQQQVQQLLVASESAARAAKDATPALQALNEAQQAAEPAE